MKNIILLFSFFSLSNLFAQENCKKRTLNDVEKGIIREYISDARKNNWYKNDIGIVLVKEDISQLPYFEWNMSVVLDDQQANIDSTFTYAKYHSEIILFKTNTKENIPIHKSTSGCWADIIGDRLYIKPPKQNRPYILTFDGWEDGKPILDENKEIRIIQDPARYNRLDGDDSFRIYQFSLEKGVISKSSFARKKLPK